MKVCANLEEVCDATEAHVVTAEESSSAVKDEGDIILVPARNQHLPAQ